MMLDLQGRMPLPDPDEGGGWCGIVALVLVVSVFVWLVLRL